VTIAELGCVGQIHLVFSVFLYVLWITITRINANIRTEITETDLTVHRILFHSFSSRLSSHLHELVSFLIASRAVVQMKQWCLGSSFFLVSTGWVWESIVPFDFLMD